PQAYFCAVGQDSHSGAGRLNLWSFCSSLAFDLLCVLCVLRGEALVLGSGHLPQLCLNPSCEEIFMRSTARIASHPIHPMLVAFPIGLWIPSFILDLLGRATGDQLYWQAGFIAIIGGCIAAVIVGMGGPLHLLCTVP